MPGHTHGTKLLPGYIRRLLAGGYRPQAVPNVVCEGPAWAVSDGEAALGQIDCTTAMRLAIAEAKPAGVASVAPQAAVIVDEDGQRLVVPFHDPEFDAAPDWLPLDMLDGADMVHCDVRWPAGAEAVRQACTAGSLVDEPTAAGDFAAVARRVAKVREMVRQARGQAIAQ